MKSEKTSKTSKKSPKGKAEVAKENKKPPVQVVEQKETTKSETSKNQTKDKNNKKPTTKGAEQKDATKSETSKNQAKDKDSKKQTSKKGDQKDATNSETSKNKTKDKDNKKPTVKVVEQKEKDEDKKKETKKTDNTKNQTKDEKNSKNSKVSKNSKNVKIQPKEEKTEDKEKENLKGQNHIENKIDEKPENNEIIENKYKPPQPSIKEEGKQIIVKPIQTFLQEKIVKMNCNTNLMNNINKEMTNKIKNVLNEEGVIVGNKTKDLKKCMEVKDKTRAEIEHYMNKQKYKEMKNLKDELNSLTISLKQVEENEKIIIQSNEQNLNKNNLETSKEKIAFDKSQNLSKLREIQAKKNELQEKIADVNYRIKYTIENENLNTIPNKQRVRDFITNFERDKEIIEIRAKKYFQEAKERDKRKQKDINQIMEKRKKEIEQKEKETEEQNNELRKQFKKDEKDIEKKWSQKNQDILLKYKPYMSNKLEKKTKNYLYNIKYQKFLKTEKKYIQKKTEQNKEKKDKITYKFDDIDKFAQEFDEKIETRKYDQEQKSMELYQKWNDNKEKLPKNNMYQSMEIQNKKKILEEEKKSQTIKKKVKKYAEDIRENFSPEINTEKRKQLQTIIQALEDPKTAAKRYTLKNQKKNRIIIKKRDTSKPSKYKWELKLDPNPNKEENYIKKPKKINLLPITRTSTEIPIKKPNYLTEIINKRKKNRSNSSKGRDNYEDEFVNVNQKNEKWENVMKNNNSKSNILENINKVQNKVESLEQEAEEKEKLLKLRGGIENNPELGKQVSNLIIDSIEAKINMLKKMNNVQ